MSDAGETARSPLVAAVLSGRADDVGAALRAGADPNTVFDEAAILCTAAEFARPDVVRLLIEAGADVNAVAGDGRTALLAAVWSADSSPEVVAVLVEAGADSTVRHANYAMTALEWADEADKPLEAELLRGP